MDDLDRATLMQDVSAMVEAEKHRRDIIGMIAEGDRVAVEASGEMTYPSKVCRNRYHNLMAVCDGLIVEGREYLDTPPVADFMAN